MLVTIMTDASHCPDSKVGGYGYWIVSERGRLKGGAEFKSTVKTVNHAEAMAIVNGMYCALMAGLVQDGDAILVQTDSMTAISVLSGDIGGYDKILAEWKRLTNGVLRIVFRHVKAHSGVRDARSHANRYCDEVARKSMRRARHALAHKKTGRPNQISASG